MFITTTCRKIQADKNLILWRITTPTACGGILVSPSGRITKSADYFKFMLGMHISYVCQHYGNRNGWTVVRLK
jgi:hypothetical protein